jgi:hypothetical protein
MLSMLDGMSGGRISLPEVISVVSSWNMVVEKFFDSSVI